MISIEFYFDYRSPYAYLAQTQLRTLKATLVMRPFEIADVMRRVENVPTSVICKAKNRYVQADLKRWAAAYGVLLNRHPGVADIDARRLLRATLAAGRFGHANAAAEALFRGRWCDAVPLATAGQVADLLAKAGLNASAIEPLIDDPSQDEALDLASAAAAERGVFGAPTFFVGDEMYFGNDRLDFVRARLETGP